MPRWSKYISGTAPNGEPFTAIVCGSSPHRRCSVAGCTAHASIECDYPVERKGKPATCDRRCCRAHAKSVGDDTDWCLPHVKLDAARAAP